MALYEYQTHNKVIGDEFRATVNTVFDSPRYHRGDASIVWIVVPERPGLDADAEARSMGVDYFDAICALLPGWRLDPTF